MNYHGQTALQTAVLVAFTQLIPEHQVQFFGALSVRVKVITFNIPTPCVTPHPFHACPSLPHARSPLHASAIPSRPFTSFIDTLLFWLLGGVDDSVYRWPMYVAHLHRSLNPFA
jgi:hypothetical protein